MHIIVSSEITPGTRSYFSMGYFTSSKDKGTIKISNKQYVNKDNTEINKEQRFRPLTQLVLLDKNYIEEYKEATIFARNTNHLGENIQDKIINSILGNQTKILSNPIREPYFVSKEIILN